MDTKLAATRKGMLAIILLCLVVSSSSEQTGQVIDSPTKPEQQRYGIGYPTENQNQPILGHPSSSSSVNQPLTGLNQPLTGFNQPSSTTGFNQPIIGQQSGSSSSSLNQPLTGLNQPSPTGFNQPLSSSALYQNQPFANRLNQNSLTGNSVPFLNGNSKLEVSATTIVSISIALLLAMYGTRRN